MFKAEIVSFYKVVFNYFFWVANFTNFAETFYQKYYMVYKIKTSYAKVVRVLLGIGLLTVLLLYLKKKKKHILQKFQNAICINFEISPGIDFFFYIISLEK